MYTQYVQGDVPVFKKIFLYLAAWALSCGMRGLCFVGLFYIVVVFVIH